MNLALVQGKDESMNKTYLFVVLIIISMMIGCSSNNERNKAIDQNNNQPAQTSDKLIPAADNTGRNERDRNSQTLTPPDQQENSSDLKLTQQIRKSIMADSSLSTNAKNVKIISEHNTVTLRGAVNSAAEKNRIEEIAKKVAGVKNVNNLLEITSS